MRGYYFITDAALSKAGNFVDMRNAVAAGACAVQYRNKGASSKELYNEALVLRSLCIGVPFIVNDRVDIALAVNADGIHLGQDDLPYSAARKLLGKNKIIGITAHSLDEAVVAERAGADYIGVSPIFATTTKADAGAPSGIELIQQVKKAVKIPVTAIGGITLENAVQVVEAGADSLCAISSVITKEDVKAEIERFKAFYRQHLL